MRRGQTMALVLFLAVVIGLFTVTVASGKHPLLGLDLQGGASVVLQPKGKVAPDKLRQTKEIIESRVNALGVGEPDIAIQGSAIVVQLPGVKDQDRALRIVGQTAQLRFRPVLQPLPLENAKPTTTTTAKAKATTTTAAAGATTTTGAPGVTSTVVPTATPTTTTTIPSIPTTPREKDDPKATVVLPEREKGKIVRRYQLGPAELTGTALKTAHASFNSQNGSWAVDFEMTSKGSDQFDALAAKYVQRQLAITLDGEVKSAPTIQQTAFHGSGQITGNFTEKEAKDLALVLRFGALPVTVEPQTVQKVSASLGSDSLKAGIIAGLAGLALVLLYMILYYRALGLVVLLGLLVSAMAMWAIVSQLGAALTLAGATGMIISVGVTVDSYVVFFERLKDEIRSGKTIRSSVDRGFSRAYRTILAADAASFIGAFLLYTLTVGPVRGFAFFLGLSTLLDVAVAWFFTRPMVMLLGRNRFFTEARWFGVARGLAAGSAA